MSKQQWSKDRPHKPEIDPMLGDLRAALALDNRSTFAKANVSGLSQACITNILNHKTRRPQAVTYQMAYKMLGYELRPMPIRRS